MVDLFAGVGGFSLGFMSAKQDGAPPLYDVRLLVDVDGEAAATFKQNHPRVAYWVQDLNTHAGSSAAALAAEIRRHARLSNDEDIDIVVGGPPCQGFSRLKKWSPDDPRNERIFDYASLLLELRPRMFLMENVPTLLSQTGEYLLDRFALLVEPLYDTKAELVFANEYGVPQLRQRTIVVGFRRNAGLGTPFIPRGSYPRLTNARMLMPSEDDAGGGEIQRIAGSYITVEDAIGDLPPLQPGEGAEAVPYGGPALTRFQAERRQGSSLLFNHKARRHSKEFLEKIRIIEEGSRNQELADDQRFSDTYFSQAYARLHRRGIAQTITTSFSNPGSGRFTHYRDLRSLTVREAARLQSFDDRFRFFGVTETQQRHVGNAVPPLLARALAMAYARALLGDVGQEAEPGAAG